MNVETQNQAAPLEAKTVSPHPPAPEQPLPRWKKWLFGAVMVSLVLAVLQVASYAYLRVFRGYDGRHLMQYEFDPYKNILPTRNYVDTRGVQHNAAGFRRRGEVGVAKPAGTIRVFLMGASTAYGLGGLWPHLEPNYPVLRNEETIDAYVEKLLAGAFPGRTVEVVNAAITSTWTHHTLIYLYQSILKYQPDMVLFLDGFNDFYHVGPTHDQFESYGYNGIARTLQGEPTAYSLAAMNGWWFFRKFALAHVAGRAAQQVKMLLSGPSDLPINPDQRFTALQEAFPRSAGRMHEYIGRLLQQERIPAVFMLQPMLILERERTTGTALERKLFEFNVRSYRPGWERFMRLSTPWIIEQEQAMASRVGATFIDLTTAFRGVEGQVYTDYCHLTPLGNRVLAGIIAQHVTPLLQARVAATR